MFESDRYATRGVSASIPMWLQAFLWRSIVGIPPGERDYLQVFQLSPSGDGRDVHGAFQEIVHTQEKPEFLTRYLLTGDGAPVTAKVFVIDDDTHSTMLLAEEY